MMPMMCGAGLTSLPKTIRWRNLHRTQSCELVPVVPGAEAQQEFTLLLGRLISKPLALVAYTEYGTRRQRKGFEARSAKHIMCLIIPIAYKFLMVRPI